MAYDWPGNIRELKNAIEHAFVVCSVSRITAAELPVEIIHSRDTSVLERRIDHNETAGRIKLTKAELISVLNACGWNKAEAGRQLGFSRVSIWKYMKKWNIPLKQ